MLLRGKDILRVINALMNVNKEVWGLKGKYKGERAREKKGEREREDGSRERGGKGARER